ncbi:magnesium and cobalt transport protein CorA [Arenibacter sp. TNZ]|uniref:magnesium/cobalt transporter CorA n=1 Tax=Arenibacter TaxID=178469 RepID=UPI000CD4536F|nr:MULTISPECIES: magnesium/cobalt transporter CorA [Arenibacter]MCM4171055.1 magnesium and cobalt transport protein CorA [Arenibacter sp. TNZ]
MSKKKPTVKKHSIRHIKTGKSPGTVTYLGSRGGVKSVVNIMEYNKEVIREASIDVYAPSNFQKIIEHQASPSTSWINVIGISDENFIENLGNALLLNPLTTEDVVNTHQRPKIDEYDHYIFGAFKMLYVDGNNELVSEHVAIVLMENTVLIFQEMQDDVFDSVRERARQKTGRIRTKSADYLFFALLDAIIDNYFVVLENVNQKIDFLEEEVYDNPSPKTAHAIQDLKKEILRIRRYIYPVKELISKLIDTEHVLISNDTKIFLRDTMDHCTEINESLNILREMSMSLMEMYMSNMSNKMNEVMKVLTIMASIFIPLTFIVGVYGMNFEYIPELKNPNGYFYVWGLMIAIFIGLLFYFKKKRWL